MAKLPALRVVSAADTDFLDLIDEEIERSGKAVQLFEIDIEHISGKEIQEK